MAQSQSRAAGDEASAVQIYEEIGSGSFGKVYRAFDPVMKREVAVKMIQLDTSNDLETFLLELKFLRELRCRNITQVLASALHDSVLWVTMEYCAAGSCTHLLRRYGTFTEAATLYVLHEALLGLAYIHKQRKIHRDLKSANILVTEHGDVKIADFGVSAQLSDQMPQRDTFMGTPYWMAPEVIAGEKYGTAVDVWSLGIVAIELMTGTPPLRRHQPNEVIHMIMAGPPPRVPDHCAASKNFRRLVHLCLQKQPHERPSADALLKCAIFRPPLSTYARSSAAYMPRPPEFVKVVARAVRDRRRASLQRPVSARTAADIHDLAPAKTLHSRTQWPDARSASMSDGDSDWRFTVDENALPADVKTRRAIAPPRGMPRFAPDRVPPRPGAAPASPGPSAGSSPDSPDFSPDAFDAAAGGAMAWRPAARSPGSESRSPPAVPRRSKRRSQHAPPASPALPASSALPASPALPVSPALPASPASPPPLRAARAAQRRSNVPFQIASPLAQWQPAPPPHARHMHAASGIPVAAAPRPGPRSPPKPLRETTDKYNDYLRPTLAELVNRVRWEEPAARIREFGRVWEDMDRELPGFTETFIQEFITTYLKKKMAEREEAQARPQPPQPVPVPQPPVQPQVPPAQHLAQAHQAYRAFEAAQALHPPRNLGLRVGHPGAAYPPNRHANANANAHNPRAKQSHI